MPKGRQDRYRRNGECGDTWKCAERGDPSGKGDESVLSLGNDAKIVTLWTDPGTSPWSKWLNDFPKTT